MKLQDVLKGVNYHLLSGNIDQNINDIKFDSRKITKNDMYVALIGYTSDGHDYIDNAIKNGASVIVTSKIIDIPNVTIIKVDDTRISLSYMSANFFNHPEKDVTLIALTGTAGKTTTTHMISNILNHANKRCGLIGSQGIKYDDIVIHTNNTTPESYDVFASLRKMVDVGIKYVAMEASSQAFKLNRLAGLIFDYGILTNISNDHVGPGEHESHAEYISCKNKLFLNSRNIIVNNDSASLNEVLIGSTITPISYALENNASIKVTSKNLINNPNFIGSEFTTTGLIDDTFKLSIPGEFNIYNALCAITITHILGVSNDLIKESLLTFRVRGRMEVALSTPKFKVIIDHAHTEDEMKALVKTLKSYKPKRLISVFGGGGNRPKERRYNLGEIIGGSSDLCILTMDNPRFEDITSINNDIKVGLSKVKAKYIEIPDRKEAIEYACYNAIDGDLILLVGKGHEEYQEIKGEKIPFSELEVLNKIKESLK